MIRFHLCVLCVLRVCALYSDESYSLIPHMDNPLSGAIVMTGLASLGGIAAWAFTRPEQPEKLCIRQCETVYRRTQFDQQPLSSEAFLQCVRKCCGIQNNTTQQQQQGTIYMHSDGTFSPLKPC